MLRGLPVRSPPEAGRQGRRRLRQTSLSGHTRILLRYVLRNWIRDISQRMRDEPSIVGGREMQALQLGQAALDAKEGRV